LENPLLQPISDDRWGLVERVLGSTIFEKSPRLRSFLRYICECELGGRREEINEHSIGVHVFSRAASYNPGDDSIVRSQARFLRQRLEEYFRGEGEREPLRIVIPKGSYVPFFEQRASPPAEAEQITRQITQPNDLSVADEESVPGHGRKYSILAACLVAILTGAENGSPEALLRVCR
jgi:hypothetical protein